MADTFVLSKSVVNKIWEAAQACVDGERKGWRLKMPLFRDAMDAFNFSGREVGAVLAHLSARMYMIVFLDEDGHVAGISLVPQKYRCWQCNGLLDMQDDIRRHFDDCRKRQAKIERNRKLL